MHQIEEMKNFVRIVEAGSITRAAEQRNTVKSAVSKRLSELEKRLGISLLKRTTRRQMLTDAGEEYYRHCVRILDDIDELESSLADKMAAPAGRIRMSAPISFGLMHLNPALLSFNRAYPEIELDVDFNDRRQDLVAEGLDVAIRIARLADSSLKARRLATTRMLICGSPAYFEQHGLPESANALLDGHVKLHYSHVSPVWPLRDDKGNTLSINLPAVMSANNGQFLHDAALEGKGLILSPDFIVAGALRDGRLKSVLENCIPDNTIGIYAVYPQTRYLSRRVSLLIAHLKAHFSAHPQW